jgi:hypothetical protein
MRTEPLQWVACKRRMHLLETWRHHPQILLEQPFAQYYNFVLGRVGSSRYSRRTLRGRWLMGG